MNIFCLLGMSDNKYDGILSRYAAGYSTVVSANLTTLESLMMGEDERKKILGLAPSEAPPPTMAQRTTETSKKTYHPTPTKDYANPSHVTYPPGKGVLWATTKDLIDKKGKLHHLPLARQVSLRGWMPSPSSEKHRHERGRYRCKGHPH